MELLVRAYRTLGADHPLELHGHQLRTLVDDGLEARLVVGEALDLVVLRLELR
ncbi:hypothetical protein D3C76_1626930 [compost metagenome]